MIETHFDSGNNQASILDDVAVPIPVLDKGLFASATIDGLRATVVGVATARGREETLEVVVRIAGATTAFHLKGKATTKIRIIETITHSERINLRLSEWHPYSQHV